MVDDGRAGRESIKAERKRRTRGRVVSSASSRLGVAGLIGVCLRMQRHARSLALVADVRVERAPLTRGPDGPVPLNQLPTSLHRLSLLCIQIIAY
jgi:hypothetical protein